MLGKNKQFSHYANLLNDSNAMPLIAGITNSTELLELRTDFALSVGISYAELKDSQANAEEIQQTYEALKANTVEAMTRMLKIAPDMAKSQVELDHDNIIKHMKGKISPIKKLKAEHEPIDAKTARTALGKILEDTMRRKLQELPEEQQNYLDVLQRKGFSLAKAQECLDQDMKRLLDESNCTSAAYVVDGPRSMDPDDIRLQIRQPKSGRVAG